MKKLVIIRRSSQVFSFVLFTYILWSTTYPLHGIFPPDTFFKINPLIIIFTSISERVVVPGIVAAIFMLVLTLILGRFFCGWICPLGAIIDTAGAVRKNQAEFPEKKNKLLPSIKYYVLGIIALFSFAGLQVAWVFDPMVITARFISLNLIPALTFGVDRVLVHIIRALNFYSPLYDFYRLLKASVLGINVYYFSHSGIILTFFVVICASTFITKRFWCRSACPLGAIYALTARFSLLRRTVDKCITCLKCKAHCRTAAIKDDLGYIKGECILCMDCIYECTIHKTRFAWPSSRKLSKEGDSAISRREFIFLIFGSFFLLGFKNRYRRRREVGSVIRPPRALKEEDFLDRCIRCGNCMKVCITNGLQPVILESGIGGIWTPQLIPEIGYCEYKCTLCGKVCPTGAIPSLSLEQKKKTRLGLAEIDLSICLPWAENKECIVCEEHCPVSDKAIKLKSHNTGSQTVLRPYVNFDLCIGCGICQKKCPTRPVRAIKVFPYKSDRT